MMGADHYSAKLLLLLLLATLGLGEFTPADAAQWPQQALAPTYRIYATREGLVGQMTANGHIIQPQDRFVALPSWSVLAPAGSDKFRVRVTYKGRSVVVPVWDVGPWNTKDDYWSSERRYSDLPVGQPMAEAAYLHDYNGGLDERGRRIRSPNGIDIADGTFLDDLQMNRDDWVEVSFLWLGADPGPGAAVTVNPPRVPTPAPPRVPAPSRAATPTPQPPPALPVEVEAGALVVDDGTVGYTPQGEAWNEAACGLNGSHRWTASTSNPAQASASASWAPQLPAAGFYEVLAYIPECTGRATGSARYQVYHDTANTTVSIDQQARAGTWVSLGAYAFGASGTQPRVELSDLTADNGQAVRFDVLAWAPRSDTAPPTSAVTAVQVRARGYQISWIGEDDLSGIASYDLQVRQLPKGGWTDWKRGVSETEAWFGPHEGRHFAFRVRSRDRAGNLEPWPEGADLDSTQATP